jgi:hypothetical protein
MMHGRGGSEGEGAGRGLEGGEREVSHSVVSPEGGRGLAGSDSVVSPEWKGEDVGSDSVVSPE